MANRTAPAAAAADRPLETGDQRRSIDDDAPKVGVDLDRLYRSEFARLRCFFERSVGRDAASDLAQEVFVRAAASPGFAMASNPCAYIQRIATNLRIDYFRRAKHTRDDWSLAEDSDSQSPAEQEDALIGQELDWLLTQAFSEMPQRTRAIFALNRFEEKSYREIRRELGISQSAVDYHMMKALACLRVALDGYC
jgi:RNA polymerase sigma factor (sigma-70 family)